MHQTVNYFYLYKKLLSTGFLLFFLSTNIFAASSDKPIAKSAGAIVVTIKPLYSLVAHLTEGIEQPVLLMKQPQSGHHYSLRPSERRLLANARVIIWIGQQMETSLNKIIPQGEKSDSNAASVISAMQATGLRLLNKRNKDSHHHDHEHLPATDSTSNDMLDPHIWLSTHNAVKISQHISEQLISENPEYADLYRHNLQLLLEKIKHTQNLINIDLKTSSVSNNSPFITYHDAFQYFEDENTLNYQGTINFSDESAPGLKHIQQIKRRIKTENIRCLVYQPPKPAIIDSLVRQTSIKATALDPLGLKTINDKNAWFDLMYQLATGFSQCLNP